jgi:hypothetical protein
MPLFKNGSTLPSPRRSRITYANMQMFKKVGKDKLIFRQYSVHSKSFEKVTTAVFMSLCLVGWILVLLKVWKFDTSPEIIAILYGMPVIFVVIIFYLVLDFLGSITIDLNHRRIFIRNRGIGGFIHGPRPIYFDEIKNVIFTKKAFHGKYKHILYTVLINTQQMGEEEMLRDKKASLVRQFANEVSKITSKKIIDRTL